MSTIEHFKWPRGDSITRCQVISAFFHCLISMASKKSRCQDIQDRFWLCCNLAATYHTVCSLMLLRSCAELVFLNFYEPRNRFQEIDSASLCSLAGRYDNPIPTRFLGPHRLFQKESNWESQRGSLAISRASTDRNATPGQASSAEVTLQGFV
jgi:hypothetical protein